jgi:hypothetical protein
MEPDRELVTLGNWQRGPYNRWAFQHVRELIPSAAISRGDGPVWELERDERDLAGIRFATREGELTVGGLLDDSTPTASSSCTGAWSSPSSTATACAPAPRTC